MKKDYKLLAGFVLMIAGLFQLTKSLHVTSAMFSRFHIGSFYFGNGILLIPIIIGLVWIFVSNGKSRIAPVLMIGGILCLLLGIMATANIRLTGMTFYNWIILLLLFFGGIGLILSSFRDAAEERKAERDKNRQEKKQQGTKQQEKKEGTSKRRPEFSFGKQSETRQDSIEEELRRMKEENK